MSNLIFFSESESDDGSYERSFVNDGNDLGKWESSPEDLKKVKSHIICVCISFNFLCFFVFDRNESVLFMHHQHLMKNMILLMMILRAGIRSNT